MTTAIDIQPGIYHGVPFDEYARWDAWNPSSIKILLGDSPRAMHHTKLHGGLPSTESMDLGRAEHCCVLEPVRANETYAVMPEFQNSPNNCTAKGDPSTSKATAWYQAACEAFAAQNPGKEIIGKADYDACMFMRDRVFAHPEAKRLLTDGIGQPEVSICWLDPISGLKCKGRIDWLKMLSGVLVDLKTAANPQPWAFMSQAAKLMYHVSIGAYDAGLRVLGHTMNEHHFIVVGNKPWHDVVVYQMTDSSVRIGRTMWQSGLNRTAWCIKNDVWPGFSDEPIPFELPTWALPPDEADAVSIGDSPAFQEA